MLVFLGSITLPWRFDKRSVYNCAFMSDQALRAKTVVKDLEKNPCNGSCRKIVLKFPNRLCVWNLVVKTKIQETHERHLIIDLVFRLVVRQVIQTLKDEYLEHQNDVKGWSTTLRTTRMTNITLDYASEVFPLDCSIQNFERISHRTQQCQTIALVKKASLSHTHRSIPYISRSLRQRPRPSKVLPNTMTSL